LFLGIIVADPSGITVLPADFVKGAFDEQIKTLSSIRGESTATGFALFEGNGFMQIFMNNFSVAFISFIMSFFYGAGAIFILAWERVGDSCLCRRNGARSINPNQPIRFRQYMAISYPCLPGLCQ